MFSLLSLLTALLGGALLGVGLKRYLHGQLGSAQRPSRYATRAHVALVVIGALLLVAPESLSSVLGGRVDGGTEVVLTVVRVITLVVLPWIALLMLVTTARALAGARRVLGVVAGRVPSWSGYAARRRYRLPDFPRDWPTLLDYDQQLTRRLLAYHHDVDFATNLPAMRDYDEPATKAALEAMFDCDRERTSAPPVFVRDVITTRYGVAVADFALALERAEDNARLIAAGQVDPGERRRIAEASNILGFLQTNSTTAAERDQAYAAVIKLMSQGAGKRSDTSTATAYESGLGPLDLGPVNGRGGSAGPSRHPWLDVEQRASNHRADRASGCSRR